MINLYGQARRRNKREDEPPLLKKPHTDPQQSTNIPQLRRLDAGVFLLGEIVEHSKSFADLGIHGFVRLQKVEEFRIVHLKKHTGNFASQLGLRALCIVRINHSAELC